MTPEQIAQIIEQTGLVGMLVLALSAIGFLTKKVFSQQKTIQDGLGDQVAQVKDQNDKLIKMLEDSTTASVNQTNSNASVVNEFGELKREVADRGPQLQALNESVKRVLREARLAPDEN